MSPYRGVCGCCVSLFKWIPVIVITGIVGWSYYAYVVKLCILTIESDIEKAVLLVLYHIFITFFLVSKMAEFTVFFCFNHPFPVFILENSLDQTWRHSQEISTLSWWAWPCWGMRQWRGSETASGADCNRQGSPSCYENHSGNFSIHPSFSYKMLILCIYQGSVRYCEKCACIKPDRAHHCSVCGSCVLKMDHHCPWVNNCVAFNNYKFFILFLLYGLTYCLFVALSTLKYFLRFWTQTIGSEGYGKFHILFLFFVSAMFSISLCSLLG